MLPMGPLMIEHRLIERMVRLLEAEARALDSGAAADEGLLRGAVDFLRTYADRMHHGKEEDILFAALDPRELREDHRRLMEELIEEHRTARRLVGELEGAGGRISSGDGEARGQVRDCLEGLVALYAGHIEKEDKHFFRPAMDYLSREEQQAMLDQFQRFDAGIMHEVYKGVVETLEAAR